MTPILVITKAKCFLYFYTDPNLVIQECLSAKDIVEAIPNHPLFILVTNTSTNQQHFKHKILVRVKDYISTVVCTEAPQKSCQAEQLLPAVVGIIKTEKEMSPSTSQIQKVTNVHESTVMLNEYS